MNKKDFFRIIGILAFIAVFVILIFKNDQVASVIKDSGPWAPIIATFLLFVLGPTPIATDPIIVLIAVSYNPIVGVIVGTIGNTLAMFLEYYFGMQIVKVIPKKIDGNKFSRDTYKLLKKIPVSSPLFLLIGRTIPGYGSKIISLMAGSYRVNLKTYLWTSILSALFGAVITSFGAFGIVELFR
jgi:uncharacterized membrane protein YdjX (TVP38/TMEM64 family)